MTLNPARTAMRLFCIFVLVAVASPAQETKPWSLPHFSSDAKVIYDAAASVMPKKGTEVIVLYEENTYKFDGDGRSTHTVYRVYKILSQDGIAGWDNVSATWEPWHEEKPILQARVISVDRATHLLDQKSITDSPAADDEEDVYGDQRVLRGPLPAVGPGAIVEEEQVIKESAPLYTAGVTSWSPFGKGVPVQETRLVLDAPTTLLLKYEKQLLPDVKIERTERDGRVRIEFVQGIMEALESREGYLPSKEPVYPRVFFSTGASWQTIASSYSATIDEKIRQGNGADVAKELTQEKKTVEGKIGALLQYLSKEVRYTGVEFDEAGIVPQVPAETLTKKFGDCKDKATLLVAMLRAVEIPAHVALLRVGTREDVKATLPGMGMFDHAIVYVPGPPAHWIDVTDQYARSGQLPSRDQGRMALIAKDDTKELSETPITPSAENRLYERREFYLAENGPGRVVEISRPQGAFESGFRASYIDPENKETRKKLTDYVKTEYLADKLTRFERTDPMNLSEAFQLTIEAAPAKRGFTDLGSGVAAIRRESLFYYLPTELQQAKEEESKEEAAEREKKKRTEDYQLGEAFLSEWEYVVVPPAGFKAKALPEKKSEAMGPGIYTQEFSVDEKGVVHGRLTFDTVKRQLTVVEAEEMRKKVVEMKKGQAIVLSFEPIPQALMNEGKVKESFRAARELIAQHPKSAVYHLQMANYLLQTGMGKAAREECQNAVELEPNSALAQKTLAEILEFDLVGRKFRRGSDYEGAAKAFRAAQQLDPEDHEITGNLAVLLEHNQEGERYGTGAKLDEALVEYRKLTPEQLVKIGLQNNLAFALFYSGKLVEARKEAERLNPQLRALIVAEEAITNGSKSGLAEAHKITSGDDELKTIAKSAGDVAMRYRAYPEAADLLEAGASGSNSGNVMALAAMLRKAKKIEDMKFQDTPTDLVEKMFVDAMSGKLTRETLMNIASKNALKVMSRQDPDDMKKSLHEGAAVHSMFLRQGLPVDAMMDVVMEALQVSSEGDDSNGYKVSVQAGEINSGVFVVKENGHYKMLDSSDKPNAIGLEILDRLAARNLNGARVLLDWIRQSQHVQGGDDPLAGKAFPRMWTKGKEGDAQQARMATAALLCETKETAADGVAILEPALQGVANETEKLNILLALLDAYEVLDAYQKRYALATDLAKKNPDSKRLFEDRAAALRGLGRFSEVNTIAAEWLKKDPTDLTGLRAEILAETDAGNYTQASDITKKILATNRAEAIDYNGVAWLSLFVGKTNGEDVEAATKAVQLSKSAPGILHTLGCVYAEVGKTKEAREMLVQAMDQLSLDEPDDNYWYAFGRIAEQYGENQFAMNDYEKVKKPMKVEQIPSSSYKLALTRLAAIRNEGPSGKK